jgi:AcrR family transcriptional regulator
VRQGGAAIRQKILDEALAAVRSRGAAQLTMRSLAEHLDLSPASLYLSFRSKDDLLRAVGLAGFQELERCAAPSLRVDDPVEALRGGARAYLEFALREPSLYRLMFQDLPVHALAPEELAPRMRLWAAFREPYCRGVERGVFRKADPDVVTMLHFSLMHGFVSLALTGRNPSPAMPGRHRLEELFEALIEDRVTALRP